MNCWICGDDGKTGEHLVKASDLKVLFNNQTNKKPFYFHKEKRNPQKLQNVANSKFVKSEAKLCVHCNGAKTQPFDNDWQKLSDYVRRNYHQLRANRRVKIKNVFPGRTKQAALNVHLYFAKLYGCRATSEELPIDIPSLARAINENKANPKLYIRLEVWDPKTKIAGVSKITRHTAGSVSDNFWYYVIDNVVVCVSFNDFKASSRINKSHWHPQNSGKYIEFRKRT
ncbi:hypothetical protein [Vibrio cholerae]|uniref:hypothetical protein n=1 Tax=Vibrio cholerae TaxID=666 RepID=UPI000E0B3381|nr:hypothetical protein [Vibrio cholerae]EJB8351166.1 hypothetical protein [Vibrio cholerae]EJB8380629.1 hypothetical protein [Vibrio cholerae]NOE10944.1 hypothetical protein [Vibrio cholerae]NOF31714.1 hypothetical protein [Vibrio cholerae]